MTRTQVFKKLVVGVATQRAVRGSFSRKLWQEFSRSDLYDAVFRRNCGRRHDAVTPERQCWKKMWKQLARGEVSKALVCRSCGRSCHAVRSEKQFFEQIVIGIDTHCVVRGSFS